MRSQNAVPGFRSAPKRLVLRAKANDVEDEEEFVSTLDERDPIENDAIEAAMSSESAADANVESEQDYGEVTEESESMTEEKRNTLEWPSVVPTAKRWAIYDRHRDQTGRTPLQDLQEGTELKGIIHAQDVRWGITVDIGAEYDGVVFVHTLDLDDVVDVADVGLDVTVRIKTLHKANPYRWVFPIEIELLDPDISKLQLEPPRQYAPIRFRTWEKLTVEELAAETGRPVPVVDPRADKDREMAKTMAEVERLQSEQALKGKGPKVREVDASDDDIPEDEDRAVLEGMDRVDWSEDPDADAGDVPDALPDRDNVGL